MKPTWRLWCAVVASVAALAGCGGGGGSDPQGIGPSGGTVAGGSGAGMTVPAGALTQTVDLRVTQGASGAPALPPGVETAGATFALTPHGTTFALPVTVTIPFDPGQVPAGRSVQLLKTNAAQDGWEVVAGATVGANALTAQVDRLSWFTAALVPMLPTITAQPAGLDVTEGASATFSVSAQANGAPPLTYRWQRDGVDIAGATSASYTLPAATLADDGAHFTVIVGNGLGTVTSATATLGVTAAVAVPAITAQPQAAAAAVGGSATFSVGATGATPLGFQWQRADGPTAPFVDLPGATSPSLTLSNLQLADDGARLRVRVSNAAGSVVSEAAGLAVTAAVSVRTLPRRVAMGNRIAAAVDADGAVWTWGGPNVDGELGPGSTPGVGRTQPARVTGIADAAAVFATSDGFAVLRRDGRVVGWGRTYRRTSFDTPVVDGVGLLDLTDVVQISGGHSHVLALRADGTVWAWGSNLFGQIGDGTRDEPDSPAQVVGLTGVVAVAGAGNASLAVRGDGSVWAWGQQGDLPCLGSGTEVITTPRQVQPAPSARAVVHGVHTLLWTAEGELHACGTRDVGSVYVASDAPRRVDVPAIATAGSGRLYDASLARTAPFILTVDAQGMLNGYGSAEVASGLGGFAAVAEISVGLGSALIVRGDGTVWSWGENDEGQLGDGTRAQRIAPVQVPGLRVE